MDGSASAQRTSAARGLAAFIAPLGLACCFGAARADWPYWGGDLANTRNAAGETTLTADNVSKLKLRWTYQTSGDVSATPTIENDDLYIVDWGGAVAKLNRLTGAEVWKHKLSEYTGKLSSMSRSSPAIGASVVVFGDRKSGTVIAVDKSSGKLVWKTVVDSDSSAIITGSPVIYGSKVYIGVSSDGELDAQLLPGQGFSFRGSLVALDLASGAIQWQFRTVPQGYAGGAIWSSTPVIDAQRKSVYVTTGNNTALPADVQQCVSATTDPDAQLACMADDNYFDAVLALDLDSGALKWSRRLSGADAWTTACLLKLPGCDYKGSPDFDFGSGANLISYTVNGQAQQLVGAGQKSGVYWALDPADGHTVWSTRVGPGSFLGGIMWGSASDGARIYVANSNSGRDEFTLGPQHTQSWKAGSWAALDVQSGSMLWQVPEYGKAALNPLKDAATSAPMTVANGVVFAGSPSGEMLALNASSGAVLWKFKSGGTVMSGPAIVGGIVYWGSGYKHLAGTGNRKLYAFDLP